MRIIMLVGDETLTDRRILLRAETLISEGNEVIVIARKGVDSPSAARIGRVKVLWADLNVGYYEAAYKLLDPDRRPLGAARQPSERISAARVALAQAGIARMMTEFDWLDARAILDRALVVRRAHSRVRLLATLLRKTKAIAQWKRAFRRVRTLDTASLEDYEDLPHMDAWERALFYHAIYLDPDVVHIYDLPQLLAGVYARRFLGVPLVYDVREIYSQATHVTEQERHRLHEKEARLIKYCDIRLTASPYFARFMEYCYACEPFDVVLNAVMPLRENMPAREQSGLRTRLSLGVGARILVYKDESSGGMSHGLIELMRSFAAIERNIHLVTIGHEDCEDLHRLAADLGIGGRVHSLPLMPSDEVASWYSEADAAIIPHHATDLNGRSGIPSALFDFIAARLPIICSDLPFLREIVEGQGFGIAQPMRDAGEIAQAITRAFGEEGLLENARQILVRKGVAWEWPAEELKLKRIYARLPWPERYSGLAEPPKVVVNLDDCLT